MFATAPCSAEDPSSRGATALVVFAETFCRPPGRVSVRIIGAPEPFRAPTTQGQLSVLEQAHAAYDLYLWFSLRCPSAFPEHDLAQALRKTCAVAIELGLARSSAKNAREGAEKRRGGGGGRRRRRVSDERELRRGCRNPRRGRRRAARLAEAVAAVRAEEAKLEAEGFGADADEGGVRRGDLRGGGRRRRLRERRRRERDRRGTRTRTRTRERERAARARAAAASGENSSPGTGGVATPPGPAARVGSGVRRRGIGGVGGRARFGGGRAGAGGREGAADAGGSGRAGGGRRRRSRSTRRRGASGRRRGRGRAARGAAQRHHPGRGVGKKRGWYDVRGSREDFHARVLWREKRIRDVRNEIPVMALPAGGHSSLKEVSRTSSSAPTHTTLSPAADSRPPTPASSPRRVARRVS